MTIRKCIHCRQKIKRGSKTAENGKAHEGCTRVREQAKRERKLMASVKASDYVGRNPQPTGSWRLGKSPGSRRDRYT